MQVSTEIDTWGSKERVRKRMCVKALENLLSLK